MSDSKNSFEIQVIVRGSYIDGAPGDSHTYLVEALTVRLNHVALNQYLLSECLNCRECYADGAEGDLQWEAHKAEYKARRSVWTEKVVDALGINPGVGSVKITQAQAEIFTVVHIRGL